MTIVAGPYFHKHECLRVSYAQDADTVQRGIAIIADEVRQAYQQCSPSTITLHNLSTMQTTTSINLSMDVRNAIHGLEVWPYESVPDGS